MISKRSIEIIEEISSLVMLADPTDIPTLGKMINLLEELQSLVEPTIRSAVESCLSLANDVAIGVSSDPAGDINRIAESVAQIQQSQKTGETSQLFESKNCSKNSSATEAETVTEFRLPEWVEEKTFRDFISAQQSVLEDIEEDILSFENGDPNAISSLRRRIHTLKGESGVLGLDELSEVCHKLEDFFDQMTPGPEAVDRLLQVKDWIAQAIQSYARLQPPQPSGKAVIEMLASESTSAPAPESKAPVEPPVEATPEPAAAAPHPANVARDDETLQMMVDFLHEGEDGLSRADQILIEVEQEGSDADKVNSLFRVFHSLKGVAGFLGLQEITTLAHKSENVLNAVRQNTLTLAGPVLDLIFDATEMMRHLLKGISLLVETGKEPDSEPKLPALLNRLQDALEQKPMRDEPLPVVEPEERIGEVLSHPPFEVPEERIEEALERQRETGRKLGEELIASGAAQPKQVAQALRAQAAANPAQQAKTAKIKETVKVDLERVDNLLEMVGELVIVEAMVAHAPEITELTSLRVRNYLSQLTKIIRDLQSVTMSMRMVPVRAVFQKMSRLVRDLARKSGKQITMVQSGEGTEMDRSMVEQIGDPLVHMIRNAVDHGIESPEERARAGKSAQATITLAAYHEGGNIVVEISDNGRGLDRDAILRKAISQGLVREGDNLSEGEIYKLIFAPGFSTAKKVTEISGRGVGMDVVRRNVEAMRGRVNIQSRRGEGSTFKLVLPLTLAIIDGMQVCCGAERYIIPTLTIIESIQPTRPMLLSLAEEHEFINIRDEILPLLRLDRLLQVPGAKQDPTTALVVVVESMNHKVGLMVDDVLNQQQVVIKSMSNSVNDSRLFSGAAILSDGHVGLILNIDEIATTSADSRLRNAGNDAG